MSDQALRDLLTLRTLPLKTRLDDDDWLNSSLRTVCLEGTTQYSILQQGLDIAKQCVWDFLDTHRPSIRAALFPGGWPEVKFGFLELVKEFGRYRSSTDRKTFGFKQNSAQKTCDLLFAITGLRNAACHFSSCKLRSIDNSLQAVQKLAIELYDEKRAFAVRDLRDELRKAAQDTVEEVLALEPLCLLPYAEYRWKDHHKRMCEDAIKALKEEEKSVVSYDYLRLPEPIMRVAATWNSHTHGSQRNPGEVEADGWPIVEPEGQQLRSVKRRHSTVAWEYQLDAPREMFGRGRQRRASTAVMIRTRADGD